MVVTSGAGVGAGVGAGSGAGAGAGSSTGFGADGDRSYVMVVSPIQCMPPACLPFAALEAADRQFLKYEQGCGAEKGGKGRGSHSGGAQI